MDERDGEVRRGLASTALRMLALVLAVVVVAGLAGFVFGRTDPHRAARLLVADFVVDEPAGTATAAPAPTTGGSARVEPVCGVTTTTPSVQTQLAALRAGLVVVQYRGETAAERVSAWAAGRPDEVLVAPNPDIEAPVVATAWGRRMALEQVNEELLSAFVRAHGGDGPDGGGCGPPE